MDSPQDEQTTGPSEVDLGPLYDAGSLTLRHREIIRLAFLGLPQTRIADRLEVRRETVNFILRSPLAQAELARLSAEADASLVNVPLRAALDTELRQTAQAAVAVNRAILGDPRADLKLRANVARHFMDRVIFAEGPSEREGTYRDMLRKLDEIERNTRLTAEGATLFPPGAINDLVDGAKGVDGSREPGPSSDSGD